VEAHWPALDELGLVTKMPVQVWRATDKSSGEVSFVEMFQWRDAEAPQVAHETPEVMAIWEPMVTVLEELKLQIIEPIRASGGRQSQGQASRGQA
jgi:hypothetical protein